MHILDSLNRGGAEMLVLDVCRNAPANGLGLSFAATGGGALEEDFKNSGAPFFRFQRRLPIDPRLVFALRKIITENRFDVVHTHQPVAALHAYLAASGLDVRHALTFHGFYDDAKNRLTARFLAPRMDANVSCSKGLLEWLAASGNLDVSKFRTVYNGVDAKRLAYDGENLKTELKLPENAFLFGMVSHFYAAPRKDQATLCRAFARVADRLPHAHLVLVGKIEPGAEAKHAECVKIVEENNLQARAHFLGQRTDMAKIVNSLDVYVFSSLHEGLPIALIEAMLAGKACVLSDIAPHLEVSQNGAYAELFETGNAARLAKKLVETAENERVRSDLANRAQSFARETFSIEAHLENLKNLYASII
ncbi:MAG TPA: glycosyltransferase [Pyrinomonadaceae bacterium]